MEKDYWDMTLAEVERYLQSYQRREDIRMKEKAMYDYKLADMIGVSISRIFAKGNPRYPEIYEVYPGIYEKDFIEERKEQAKINKSIERLQQFADKHNKKLIEEVKKL